MEIAVEAGTQRRQKAPREVRQRQIIEATIDSISRRGFAETTLATVAKRAGISQASLIFHFKTKEALLVATLRRLSEEYGRTWRAALAAAPAEPIARICALAAADFEPHLCSRKKVAVWHAFWGESKSRPTYMQICGERDEERFEAMVRECARALEALRGPAEAVAGEAPQDAIDRASLIDGLSDGLWQRLLMEHRSFGRQEGLRLMFQQIASQFPEAAAAIEAEAERLWRGKARTRKQAPEIRPGAG